ncbi:hypothetical protein Dimus_030542 [Dionaea muscipula]
MNGTHQARLTNPIDITVMPTAISATDQPPTPPPRSPPSQVYAPPPITAVLTILIMVLFFVGFFSLYFCKCFMESVINNMNNRQPPGGTPANPSATESTGLDPSIISTFPTFPYSSVKGYRREKYGLECAICLCEFDDEDLLRLLTRCCHVFHQECIDLWLGSHRSCPVCRRSLDGSEDEKSPGSAPAVMMTPPAGFDEGRDTTLGAGDAMSIVIKDDDEEEHGEGGGVGKSGENGGGLGQFSRSHSTGHSILRIEEDKYTLRLPEEVKESLTRRHQATASCTTFGEYSRNSTRRHGCFGEISGSCTGATTCADTNRV